MEFACATSDLRVPIPRHLLDVSTMNRQAATLPHWRPRDGIAKWSAYDDACVRGAVRLLLIASSRQNLASPRSLAVLMISQTFPNLCLVGAKACVLWLNWILPAISGLLRLK
jgi:hypothetical protein